MPISADSEWFNGHDYGLTQINQIHEEWLSEMGWTLTTWLSRLRIFALLTCCGIVARKLGSVAGHLGVCHVESPRLAT
jgi:site-specific recombinase